MSHCLYICSHQSFDFNSIVRNGKDFFQIIFITMIITFPSLISRLIMSTEKEEVFLGSSHAKENGDADGTKLVRLTVK